MNKKAIFTALALGGAIVYAVRKMTQSRHSSPKQGPAKMGTNVRKMSSPEGGHITG